MRHIYTFGIYVYGYLIRLAALFNKKAKKWVNGRRNWQQRIPDYRQQNRLSIWFHVSSLGEYEQARPVIEGIQNHRKEYSVVLSFFSPSGFENFKDNHLVDYMFYLPLDIAANMKLLVTRINPAVVCFAKYDFWFNLLSVLNGNNIPFIYFSVLLRDNHFLTKPYSGYFLNLLGSANSIFVQDANTLAIFTKLGFSNVIKAGDTRIDRVLQIKSDASKLGSFSGGKPELLLILGSSYEAEERISANALKSRPQWKCIVAPHNITAARIDKVKQIFNDMGLACNIWHNDFKAFDDNQILIVDTIGQLKYLYAEADVVFLGGGFGKSIHNLLEPAVYGMPVVFGKNHHKFPEAKSLLAIQQAFEIENHNQLIQILDKAANKTEFISHTKRASQAFFNMHKNASSKVVTQIEEVLSAEPRS